MQSKATVALAQMVTSEDIAHNAGRIHESIDRAAGRRAQLLVVPECALSGYPPPRDLDWAALHEMEKSLAEHACEARMALALGTVRREGGRVLNTARLYDSTGRPVATYDKTHLTDVDEDHFAPGDSLALCRLGEWTVALQICFDMRFPENWRILRRLGAELVIHLSNASRSGAWKVPVLEGAVRSRAAENGMFVLSANDARVPQMMVSAAVDPRGCDLARAPLNRPALLFAEVDRTRLCTDYLARRRTDLWNTDAHRPLLLS
jgi:predicted amidohydrolase